MLITKKKKEKIKRGFTELIKLGMNLNDEDFVQICRIINILCRECGINDLTFHR